MRLIDADRLIDEFEDTIGNPISRTRLKLQVQNQPTVDAVGAVHCRDCKHASPNGKYGCKSYHYRLYECHEMGADDYCSYGERETDG